MKTFITALTLALSISSFASTTKATDALKSIVEAGTFQGKNCSVTVSHGADTSSVQVTANGTTEFFGLINTTSTTSYAVHVNEVTGEISASQTLKYPRYYNGGSKLFYAKPVANGKALISISTILLDHRGEDQSTYASCEISK